MQFVKTMEMPLFTNVHQTMSVIHTFHARKFLFFLNSICDIKFSLAAVAKWEHRQLGSNFQSFCEFESRWECKNFAQKFVLLTD